MMDGDRPAVMRAGITMTSFAGFPSSVRTGIMNTFFIGSSSVRTGITKTFLVTYTTAAMV